MTGTNGPDVEVGPAVDGALPPDVADAIDAAPERFRALAERLYRIVDGAMPAGYERSVDRGFVTWAIPLADYPDTYNGQPLQYVALKGQKGYVSVYLMGVYSQAEEAEAFRQAWAASTGHLDMGKSCLRLKKDEQVDAELLATTVAATPPRTFIETYERIKG
ncbi:DUF1801 domain-containing protein [Georgenia sp. Z1344]|uniref:DUF1801 domain-containing protein n=1 Tax=Georgenia sp. Z1344 TaxID=3416706 RepID=UPI003CE80696